MQRLTRIVRAAAASLGALAAVISVLIVFNVASFGSVELQRLREPTLVFWICVLAVFFLRPDRTDAWARWSSRVETWFASPRAFAAIAGIGGLLLVASSLTHHLAFNTHSHDLGIYQEALAGAWEWPPLPSRWLGSSFLGEHFSPVLFLIAPLYRALNSPLTLVLLHPVVLWAGVFPLAAVGRELGLTRAITNLVCLVYLFFPTVARAAAYPFHHEVFYPVVLISLYLGFLQKRPLLVGLLVVAAVAVKEDAGLYLLGMGIFFGLHHRRWRWGAPIAVAGAVSTAIAVVWIIPFFQTGSAGYGFLGRWHAWVTPVGVMGAAGNMLAAILTEDFITVIAATVLLPFRGRWTWTVVAIPVLLNLTSSSANQAQLGLYYGVPVAATAAVASMAALACRPSSRAGGLKLAAVALVINVAAFTYPSIPSCRGEVLAEIRRIDREATVAMSASFDPLLQHVERRELVRARQEPRTDLVVLRTDRYTWPLERDQASGLASRLESSPRYEERFRCDGFVIFEHRIDSGEANGSERHRGSEVSR